MSSPALAGATVQLLPTRTETTPYPAARCLEAAPSYAALDTGVPGALVVDGARTATLCRYDVAATAASTPAAWQLTRTVTFDGDVRQIVDAANALPTREQLVYEPACNLMSPPRFRLALGYHGGAQHVIDIVLECGTASRGDIVRYGGDDLMHLIRSFGPELLAPTR
ncbi:hypothetical protein BH18ACT7_BH18ACT7_08120 [soil metagenome]